MTPILSESTDSTKIIQHVTDVLRNFRPQTLREVTVVFPITSFRYLLAKPLPSAAKLRTELEKTLMTFSQATVSFSRGSNVNDRRHHSWMHMLEGFFPALAKRAALTIDTRCCESHHCSSAG